MSKIEITDKDFKPNSFKSKEAEVAVVEVSVDPVPELKKRKGFLSNIQGATIMDYIMYDVAMPIFKSALSDFIAAMTKGVVDGADTMLFGKTRNHNNTIRRSRGVSGVVEYNAMPQQQQQTNFGDNSRFSNTGPTNAFLFRERLSAEDLLEAINSDIQQYGCATLSMVNSYLNRQIVYTDSRVGWTDVSSAQIIPARGGFKLTLPRVVNVT